MVQNESALSQFCQLIFGQVNGHSFPWQPHCDLSSMSLLSREESVDASHWQLQTQTQDISPCSSLITSFGVPNNPNSKMLRRNVHLKVEYKIKHNS